MAMVSPVSIAETGCSGQKATSCKLELVKTEEGAFTFKDLPFRPAPAAAPSTAHVTHAIEVIRGIEQEPDCNRILEALKRGPAPRGPFFVSNTMPKHKRQYLVTRDDQDDTKWMIIKYFHFTPRGSLNYILDATLSDIFILDMEAFRGARTIPNTLMYMFSNMAGNLIRNNRLCKSSRTGTNPDAAVIKAGFEHIRLHCPLTNTENQALMWIEIERNNPTSPIHGWREALVEKAMRNLKHAKGLAHTITSYPITLADFKTWVIQSVIIPILTDLRKTSVMLIGVSAIGKTPLLHALAMSISGYWRELFGEDEAKVGFKSASNLDFFREEVAEMAIPALFDDGEMSTVPVPALKAFLDVAGEDVKVYARWGAARFQRHQWRAACSNSFNEDKEPTTCATGTMTEDQHAH